MTEIGKPVCELHERDKEWLAGEWVCMCCFNNCDCWMEEGK